MIAIVAAQSRNRVIGADGQLPWHMPADMARFKEITMGGIVVMGRVTYESIPSRFRPLPKRVNFVLSRDDTFRPKGCRVRPSLPGVFYDVSWDMTLGGIQDVYIIGGGQVYQEAFDYQIVDRIYLTQIEAEVEGDTFFPRLVKKDWQEIGRTEFPADAQNPLPYTFLTYHRRERLPK